MQAHCMLDDYSYIHTFPLQQWLREHASVLRFTHIACLNSSSHIQADTKKQELFKNPTKIEEIQEKKLLIEIEPLQLAF